MCPSYGPVRPIRCRAAAGCSHLTAERQAVTGLDPLRALPALRAIQQADDTQRARL
jgi:hypothetical protein